MEDLKFVGTKIAPLEINEIERKFDQNYVFNHLPLDYTTLGKLFKDLVNNNDENIPLDVCGEEEHKTEVVNNAVDQRND